MLHLQIRYAALESLHLQKDKQFDAAKWEMDKNFLYFPLKAYLNP